MVSAAPYARARSSDSGRREIAITRAPASLASRVSTAPRKPMPTIATVCPARMSLRRKMLNAQPSGSPGNGWPASAAGNFTSRSVGAMSYCANELERERRHPLARSEALDAGSERVDRAPALVAERARLGRELHPVGTRPRLEVRCADPAAFEPHAHFARAGLGNGNVLDLGNSCGAQHRRGHFTHDRPIAPG